MENEKNLQSVILNYDMAKKLQTKIIEMDIVYDISSYYNKTLIRCWIDENEKKILNNYIDFLYSQEV